jgi:hypothetical protein
MDRLRLQILTSAWQRGHVTPSDLHGLAGRLLEEGEESPSLIELFSLSPEVAPWEGPPLFERVLLEFGAQDLDDDPKPEVIAQWASEQGFAFDGLLTSPEVRELTANFEKDLVAAFPELAGELHALRFEYGPATEFDPPGIHTVIALVLVEYVELAVDSGEPDRIQRVCQFMERMATSTELVVRNALQVSLLEVLGDDRARLDKARREMGPATLALSHEIERFWGRET